MSVYAWELEPLQREIAELLVSCMGEDADAMGTPLTYDLCGPHYRETLETQSEAIARFIRARYNHNDKR